MSKFARRFTLALAVAVASSLIVSGAQAGLVIDLRLKGVTGTAFQIVDTKKVQYTYEGTGSIQFEAWAIITGADGVAALEGLNNLYGSFRSTNVDGGVVFGNLSASLTPQWQGPAWTNGAVADLDADGDLDVGSTNSSSATGWFYAISNLGATYITSANALSDAPNAFEVLPNGGLAIKLADLSFALTGDVAGPPATAVTNLDWVGRTKSGTLVHPATWQADGTNPVRLTTTGSSIASTGPIEIVPEPASIALVTLLGAVALVWFRRR